MDLEKLCAQADINKLVLQYFRGLDRFDLDLVASCFYADAMIDFDPAFRGNRDAFLEFLGGPEVLGGFMQTMHFAGNMVVDFDSSDEARTETYCVAHHLAAPGHPWSGSFYVVYLRYVDKFTRREGGWKISHRKVIFEFSRRADLADFDEIPAEARGSRDRTDPSYG